VRFSRKKCGGENRPRPASGEKQQTSCLSTQEEGCYSFGLLRDFAGSQVHQKNFTEEKKKVLERRLAWPNQSIITSFSISGSTGKKDLFWKGGLWKRLKFRKKKRGQVSEVQGSLIQHSIIGERGHRFQRKETQKEKEFQHQEKKFPEENAAGERRGLPPIVSDLGPLCHKDWGERGEKN